MMLQPQQTQQKKTSSFYIFLKSAWPVLSLIIVGVLVYIFTEWIGKVHVVSFDSLMLGLVIFLACVVAFFIWYGFKTRDMFAARYERFITDANQEIARMNREHLNIIQSERNLFDHWQQRVIEANKQQAERFETLIGQQQQTIDDLKHQLDTLQRSAANVERGFTRHVEDHTSEQQKIIKRLDELNKKINPS